MKLNILIIIIFFGGINANAQLASWTPGSNPVFTNFPLNNVGQINGICRISQMKFHATNPNKMYAVTGEGGFFTSIDAGTNWTVKAGTENLTSSCASLCIDYTNDQVVYLGTGDANYYSNGQGIYKSTDGGTTFSATTLTNCLVIEIIQDLNNASTFVAATNKGIYKSINNGATWIAKTSTAIPFCDLKRNAAANSSILYACTKENTCRFYRSTDFGDTWTQITSGITTATTFITSGGRVAVTPADPNMVYYEALGGGGIIHKSVDGGLTFSLMKGEGTGTSANPYLTFYDFDNANGLGSQGNYNNCIVVDAINPAKIWLQSHDTWLSIDGGVTWTQLTYWAYKVHTDMHQIQQSPFDATKLYSCNDGGIWLSTDGGNNWVTKSDGLYAYEIYNNCGKSSNTDRNNITIGTQDNGRVYRNANGWFCIGGGDDTRQKEYDYLPNGGYYYEKGEANRKVANGGAGSPNGFATTGNFWEYLAFNRTNTDLGFMWFTDNNLYRSTNLSAAPPTWTSVFTFTTPVMAMHSCIADPNRLYVITNDSKIQVSSNALSATPTFTTYTLPSSTTSLASITAIANNANKVYISINNKVYFSNDGGANWTNITYNLPNVNHRKILAEEFGGTQELVFIATNNAVYYKKVGQVTWTNYSTNLPGRRAPTNFTMYDDGTSQSLIRFYTYGRGVWESPFTNVRALNTLISVNSESDPSCSAHTVTFGDVSTGVPLSYAWSFPGGTPSTSSSPNPTITYTSNGTYNITLTITDASSNTSTQTISKNIQLSPQTSSAVSIVASPVSSTFCVGGSVTLNASGGVATSIVELGTGTLVTIGNSSSTTLGPNPLQNWYGGSKQLMLFTANELSSLGLITGSQLSGFAVNLAATNSAYVLQNLQVKIQNTNLNNLTSFITSGWTVVRNSANYTLSGTGWNTIPFNTNYTWNGISNILIEINYSNNNAGSSGNTALYGVTSNVSTLFYRVDNATATTLDSYNGTPSYSYSSRNNVRFSIVNTPIIYSWSPATGLNTITGAAVIASPTSTTSYTVTASTVGRCPVSATKTVTLTSYSITGSTGSNGSITPSGNTIVNCGASQTYNIVPNSCYQIATVLVDGVNNPSAVSSGTYTFSNVSSAHTIIATFTQISNAFSIAPTGVTGTTTICNGANTTISVVGGNVGTGAITQWFTGSCGGTSVGSGNSIVVAPTSTQTYYVRYSGTCNTTVCTSTIVTVNICTLTLNLKAFIQGFYLGANLMNPVLYNLGISANPLDCDSIIVELHDPLNISSVAYSKTSVIKINGTATMQFPSTVNNNSYYIVLRHRNSMETWSKTPKLFTGGSVMFDFTTP